ncbi:PhnD/SsuA/transferrin family substrate-binding protein [Thioalkalivibrio paradoxus]|uniref:Metal-dependent phosphohydrolase n=1 Tax=Thioalkalivibrio paradoxus ARh 1 TaxID=713585 RepID=W0DMM9_9GAMM|nr:PhnD/SsuA/transferrin family substrate-binding protein [Thioalkalivibrio paradoxus]AHE99686.1 metal-dependent phosphohydrolase [Thioalkalivibrio paradoxus ARh 1]
MTAGSRNGCWLAPLLWLLAAPLAAETLVEIGVLAKRGAEPAFQRWEPTAEYLSREVPGYRFVIRPLDFPEVAPAVAAGEVAFVLANPAIYVRLEADYGAARVLTMRNHAGEHVLDQYGGVVFTRTGHPGVTRLEDLRGKRFGAVESNSLGGFLMGYRLLHAHSIDPYADTSELRFLGTHDAVVEAVLAGELEAGTVRTETLEHMVAQGRIDADAVLLLHANTRDDFPLVLSTRLYPEWPLAATAGTPRELADQVARALLALPADSPVVRQGQYAGWTVPRNYQPVHDLLRDLGLPPYVEMLTLRAIWERYRLWALAALTLLLVLASGLTWVARLNRRLRHSESALRRVRDQLEERVAERTRELEAARRQWNDAFDAISHPIFIHDRDLRVVEANPAFAALSGQPLDALRGRVYWQVLPGLDKPLAACRDWPERIATEGEEVVLEDGRVLISRSFAIEHAGTATGDAIHVLEDETALRRSRENLNEAQRIARLGSWVWDLRSDALHWSDEIYRIFGVEPQAFDATYANFLEYVHPEDRSRIERAVRQALAGEAPYDLDHRIVRAEGGECIVHERARVERNQAGEPVRMVGTVQDVTETRRVQRELERLNRTLRTLSLANQALVRSKDEEQLLQQVVAILADSGGYPLAWVGFAGPEPECRVEPRAWAGEGSPYLESIQVNWNAEDPRGQGPAGRALRSGEVVVFRDLERHPNFAPWREAAAQHGLRELAALPLVIEGRVAANLNVYAGSEDAFDARELALLGELASDLAYGLTALRARQARERAEAERAASETHRKAIAGRLERSLKATIQAIAVTIEKRDPYTAGHQERVATLADALAERLGMHEQQREGLRLAASIHDIGKIGVPAEILNRPGKLTPLEFQLLQEHPRVGYEIVAGVEFPWPVAEMILQHHERLDGSGYPQGLAGEQILREARILAVADVVEAMASHRPYRPALGIEHALEAIAAGRGSLFDPEVVDACLALCREQPFAFLLSARDGASGVPEGGVV